MGANQSSESDADSSAQSPFERIPSEERHGWKVLQVMANSPSSGLGLVPYFSVLTHVDGVRCGREEAELVPLIRENVAAQLTFLNLSTLESKVVSVTPRRGWGGEGMLGLMIRWDNFENAHFEAIHVLDLHHGSPAEKAGLRAHSDYLLGSNRIALKNYDHLDRFLTEHDGKEGKLLVFNRDTFSVREVSITPSTSWGGAGSLGCDVGVGFLHQLPIDGKQAVSYEGERALDAPIVAQQQQQQQQAPHASFAAPAAAFPSQPQAQLSSGGAVQIDPAQMQQQQQQAAFMQQQQPQHQQQQPTQQQAPQQFQPQSFVPQQQPSAGQAPFVPQAVPQQFSPQRVQQPFVPQQTPPPQQQQHASPQQAQQHFSPAQPAQHSTPPQQFRPQFSQPQLSPPQQLQSQQPAFSSPQQAARQQPFGAFPQQQFAPAPPANATTAFPQFVPQTFQPQPPLSPPQPLQQQAPLSPPQPLQQQQQQAFAQQQQLYALHHQQNSGGLP